MRKHNISKILLIFFLIGSFCFVFSKQSLSIVDAQTVDWWPQFGHDSSHTGYSSSSSPSNNSTLWIYNTRDQIKSNLIVYNDILVLAHTVNKHDLTAINATTGLTLWTYDSYVGKGLSADNGRVIIESSTGLQSLDISNGELIWNASLGFWLYSPVISGGRVFANNGSVGFGTSGFFAFDENTGDLLWSITSTSSFTPCAVNNNLVYVGSGNLLYCLDASNGQQKWTYSVTYPPTGQIFGPATAKILEPCVADNKVFFATDGNGNTNNDLFALNVIDGKFLWSFSANPQGRHDSVFKTPAFHSGKIFAGSSLSIDNYGSLFSFDANTGNVLWNSSLGGHHGTPAIADGKVFVLSYNGVVQAFNEFSGQLVWNYETGGSASSASLAVANGRVYAGSGNGKLYCFGNMLYYSISINPKFYDNLGNEIYPSMWQLNLPNGTTLEISGNQTFIGQIGVYTIQVAILNGVRYLTGQPTTLLVNSNSNWNPSVNCVLPTTLNFSLGGSPKVGLAISIRGSVTCNQIGVPNVPVLFSYSVTNGNSWSDITLVETNSNGEISAVWMLPATGNYIVKATWAGNNTFPPADSVVNFCVTQSEDNNIFSVTSNSTLSNLNYNATLKEFSFMTEGQEGTKGYADVSVPKTLSSDISQITLL